MISLTGYTDRRAKLGTLTLDVMLTEEVSLPSEVSRYSVEDGSTITDHITMGSETIRISGMVSTADVNAFAFLIGEDGDTEARATKLVDAVDQLRQMHKARALVTISTGQMRYEDFAFTDMNAVRTSDEGGNWLSIRAELVQVRKVTLKTAEVPEDNAKEPAKGRSGKTKTAAGKNATKAASKTGDKPALTGRDNVGDNVGFPEGPRVSASERLQDSARNGTYGAQGKSIERGLSSIIGVR